MTSNSIETPPPVFTGPDLCAKTAVEIVDLLKTKKVSPEELLDACFHRIAAVEPAINAVPTLCEARARDSVESIAALASLNSAEPGWLGGMPISIKDLTPVKGVRTTWGTPAMAEFVPEESAPLVERLEARGGIVVGKSNTPEMGAGGNTFNAVHGQTRNPWDVRKNAGGSSGGAAASLAAGETWLAHGSDLAGSLRTPAAYCGVIGLRPSPGRSGGGPGDLAFNHEGVKGPMARNVLDTALFLDAMCGFDAREPLSIEAPATSFQTAVREAKTPVRIAYAPDLNGFAPVETEIDSVMRRALEKLQPLGTVIEEACPDLPELYKTYVVLRGFFWAALPGRLPEAVQAGYKATLTENINFGRNCSIDDLIDAHRYRSQIFSNMQQFLETYDVLACPVVGLEPGLAEVEFPPSVNGEPVDDYIGWLRFSFLATATGLPALSIPAGRTASGMPVGLQLIGPPRGEAKLLAVASILENVVGFAELGPIDPVIV